MFHLFTHAFFKALLFLGAGSVIHAMHHEQDMRHMGALRRYIPATWITMLIGTIAITGLGIPLTAIGAAGFYSKDAIIEAAYGAGTQVGSYAFIIGVVAAAMTSFYSWRLMFMTFEGRFKSADHHHRDVHEEEGHHPVRLEDVHDSPSTMMVPLYILSAGALLAGAAFAWAFLGEGAMEFWRGSVVLHAEHEHEFPLWVLLAPFIASILGLAIAYYYYIRHPELPPRMAAKRSLIYLFLYNKWYFDEIYDFLFVRPARRLARILWKTGDERIIDGLGPNGISARILDATRGAVRLQTGYVYHYAFAMLMGAAALITWFLFNGAAR
jgi:NADH-quinone oxidoreductase subunit L